MTSFVPWRQEWPRHAALPFTVTCPRERCAECAVRSAKTSELMSGAEAVAGVRKADAVAKVRQPPR
jgi:hypothetical protein